MMTGIINHLKNVCDMPEKRTKIWQKIESNPMFIDVTT